MTSEKDARKPTPEKAWFGPYFELARHYFKMVSGDSLENETCLSDPYWLLMWNILIRDIPSQEKNISTVEEELVAWADLQELDCQVHQSQAYQAALKAFVAIALALSIDELETTSVVTQNPIWLHSCRRIACMLIQHWFGLCQATMYQVKLNLLQTNAQ